MLSTAWDGWVAQVAQFPDFSLPAVVPFFVEPSALTACLESTDSTALERMLAAAVDRSNRDCLQQLPFELNHLLAVTYCHAAF